MRVQNRIALTVGFLAVFFVAVSWIFFSGQKSTERGIRYLAGSYSSYDYDDPYLQYVYPGEALPCDSPYCRMTYRLLDGYFSVEFLYRELSNPSVLLRPQLEDAERVFQFLLPTFRESPISNVTMNPSGSGIALDTMCILGFLTRDQLLAEHVLGALDADDNWIAETHYRDGRWRNIADETWCLRLLAVTGVASEQLSSLVEKQIVRADAFITGSAGVSDKAAVFLHMLRMLNDVPNERFQETMQRYASELQTLSGERSLQGDALLQANMLTALRTIGQRSDATKAVARRLRADQDADGAWRRREGEPIPVLTTASVLTALLVDGKE